MSNHFQTAERFLILQKKCRPQSWADTIRRINEMILTPLITLFFLFTGQADVLSVVPSVFSTFQSWRDWLDYQEHRFAVQRMYMGTMRLGGPTVRTNDTLYMPYVFAHTLTSAEQRR
jgi:hypothetical protein